MEFTSLEITILEGTEASVANQALVELDEIRLAMVGGGVGEVIFG